MSVTINIPVKRKINYPDLLINQEETVSIDVVFDYVSAVINTDGSESSAMFNTSISGVDGSGTMQIPFTYNPSGSSIQEQAESALKQDIS